MSVLEISLSEEQRREIDRREGREEAHKEDAQRLKAEGVGLDVIHRVTGLPMEYLEAI